jgi:uncharacterized protein (TIGR02145 family)
MKTNYLTLFFTVATFVIILILFYFVLIDVFHKPSNIKVGNKIEEVRIGEDIWMKKNLDVDCFRNGDLIPNIESAEEWEAAAVNGQPAWCYYYNSSDYGEKYGKLYNWFAVNDPRGLAPEGFHIPTDSEWTTLTSYFGRERRYAGEKTIEIGIIYWDVPNKGVTNESDFSALLGGYRYIDGSFTNFRGTTLFWSATENSNYNAWYRLLYNFSSSGSRINYYKCSGAYVRCLRD